MKIDLVIPYQLINKGYELKYALRSAEKWLSDIGEVFIIGDLPEWCINVNHIPFEQTRGNIKWKERNIYEKVLTACQDYRLSDTFLFMNDDHFLLNEYSAAAFPNYYGSHLEINIDRTYGDYKQTLQNTYWITGSMYYYDQHCPVNYTKAGFAKLKAADWSKPYGYAIKTLYAHFNPSTAEYMEDMKIRDPLCFLKLLEMVKTRDWFSINDRSLNDGMKILLNHLYPDPSKYER